ncbi:MAG: hypothetical protein P8Y01_11325, partial [Woeseiaceae bacterium]
NTPVSIPEGAGEGGAWGMALLAAYAARDDSDLSLADFLDRLLGESIGNAVVPDPDDVAGFETFYARYREGLAIEAAAVEHLR